METFVTLLKNPNQRDVFYKMLSVSEDSQIYMAGFDKNNDKKKKNVIGTVTLMGTYNTKKATRDAYEVKVYSEGKSTFWCTCPYHKFKSSKEGTVCKHICFLVSKVAKHYGAEFYDTKVLDPDVLSKLIERFESRVDCKRVEMIDIKSFTESDRPIDDVCPICYDDIVSAEVCCPSCGCHIHDACMEVWLERQKTCVYCRSDVWKHYGAVKSGKKIAA